MVGGDTCARVFAEWPLNENHQGALKSVLPVKLHPKQTFKISKNSKSGGRATSDDLTVPLRKAIAVPY